MKKKDRLKLVELERKLQALEQKVAEWEKCRTQLQEETIVSLNGGDAAEVDGEHGKTIKALDEEDLRSLQDCNYSFVLWYDEDDYLHLKINGQSVDDIKSIQFTAENNRIPIHYQCTRYMPFNPNIQVALK